MINKVNEKNRYISQLLSEDEMTELCHTYDVGIETIEFSISDNLDHLDETIDNYQQQLERIQPCQLGLHGPFLDLNPASYESLVAQASRKRYEQCYYAAKKVDADYIVFHSCFIPSSNFLIGWPERLAAFFREFIETQQVDIPLYLENVFDPDPQPLVEIVDMVDHPLFGICLDIGHAHAFSDVPVEAWIQTMGKRIQHTHIHNNDGTRDAHQALNHGTMDMKAVLNLLDQYADVRSMTIENSQYADARASLEFLKEM